MSRLTNLMEYYVRNRRVGHTTFMLEGLDFTREAIVLCASNQHAKYLMQHAMEISDHKANLSEMTVGMVKFRSIAWLDQEYLQLGKIAGPPVMVEHYALQELYWDDQRQWSERLEKAEAKND